ncbi:hypothetical protein FCV25MIE_28308 [Fagus crenata]
MNVPLIEQQTMLQHIASVARSAATSTVPIVVDIEQGILRVVQQVDDSSHVDDTIMILKDLASVAGSHGISCLPEVFHVDEVLNRVSMKPNFQANTIRRLNLPFRHRSRRTSRLEIATSAWRCFLLDL